MKIVNQQWVNDHLNEFLDTLHQGDIIIYPTDTIYGIGCDARNEQQVNKLRELKHRPDKPFSVIAPSKEWITEHFIAPPEALALLPGPVTIILSPKQPGFLPPSIHPHHTSIGVRIPDHWFAHVIQQAGIPFITTSVNLSDQPHMTSVKDIPSSFHDIVSICIDVGPIHGTSSTKYNYT